MLRNLAFLLLLAITVGCSGPYSTDKVAAKETAATEVSVIPVAKLSMPEVVTANGELFAEESTNVTNKVPGRIAKMYVDLGSVVKAGDVLAELETDDYRFRVQQTEALAQVLEPGHQIRAVQPEAAPVLHHPQPFSRAIEVGVQQAVDSLLLIGCRGCHKKRG